MKLGVEAARGLKPGEMLRDHDPRSKGLELRARGKKKIWYLYYRARDGAQRRPKIGEFPSLSIEAAREAARAWKLEIAKGEDPSLNRKALRAAPSMNDLCDHYIKEHAERIYAPETLAKARDLVRLFIRPALGSERVADVTTLKCNRLLARIVAGQVVITQADGQRRRNKPSVETAKLVRAYLSKMFSLAEGESLRWRPRYSNPCRDTEITTFAENKREVHMHENEFFAVGAALETLREKFPYHVACLFSVLFCGSRITEMATARQSEIHIDEGGDYRITLAKHKTAKKTGATSILLPPQAVAEIRKLAKHSNGYIFGPLGELKLPRRAIWDIWDEARRLARIRPGVQARDLRRTFASAARSSGSLLEDIQAQLRHKDVKTTQRYAYLFKGAQRALVDRTADEIQKRLNSPVNQLSPPDDAGE